MGKEKTKILHIITRLIAAGADENTLFTVQGINNNDLESHLLVGGQSEIVEETRSKDIYVIVVKSLVRNINPLKDIFALWHIYRFLKKNKYQIVHTHTAKAGIIGRMAAKFAGVPIIIHTLHGLSFHDYMPSYQKIFFVFLERYTSKFTDIIISVGENIKKKSIEQNIGNPDKYVTIYSGMDLSRFSCKNFNIRSIKNSLDLNETDFILGTVTRLELRKGPQYFVRVIEEVNKTIPNVKGIIVGTGNFEGKLKILIDELNLTDNIILTGFRKDVAEIMSIFDVICLTSLWEGIPRVLIQGALLGKPLIAFDIDGNSEVVSHGINGYLTPALDVISCAQKIMYLIQNESERIKMGKESERIIDTRWDKITMIKQIEKNYRELITRKLNAVDIT